jgi:hypothetical protein
MRIRGFCYSLFTIACRTLRVCTIDKPFRSRNSTILWLEDTQQSTAERGHETLEYENASGVV